MALVAGCTGTRTETFDITVKNDTPGSITLSLAKDGPPYEPAWATPEDLATESPRRREEWAKTPGGMRAVPPGKTAEVRGLTGRFDPRSSGYLRVYAGEPTISEMLSRSRESPDRVDVPLAPGRNDVTVTLNGTRLKATTADGADASGVR